MLLLNIPVVTDMNAEPTVFYDATTQHRLTVRRDGSIRIKLAIGSTDAVGDEVIARLTVVARKALADSIQVGSTLRGKYEPTENGVHRITMYNNSKSKKYTYDV